MLVLCWQQAHLADPSRPLVPVTGTTPSSSSHSSLENMKLSAVCHRPMAALDWPVLASYWLRSARTGCVGLCRPSCFNCVAAAARTANRRPAQPLSR